MQEIIEYKNENWFLIDAKNQVLGRLSCEIANILMGKKYTIKKKLYSLSNNHVVIINAQKVLVTGNKKKKKLYHHHTGYIGGLKTVTYDILQQKYPAKIIQIAVKGMLPKNKLGRSMYSKLKVYSCNKHPHISQNPQSIQIT